MKKVELHTHTNYSSDSITSFEEIIDSCEALGVDVLAVTDHNQIDGALRLAAMAPFKVIVGEEILTKQGEIIGLFLKTLIPAGLSMDQTIKLIKAQGGLVYLPHPFDKTTRRTSVFTSEIMDFIDDIDIVEIYNGRTVLPWDNYKARKLAKQNNKIMAVGSDAHTKFEYGRNYQIVKDFETPKQFLEVLRKSNTKTSLVLYWIFFITKWARFKKRTFKSHDKYIIGKENCNLCGGNKFIVVYAKKGLPGDTYKITDNSYGIHHQIVRCLNCNLIFACPIEKQDKVINRYANFEDPEYEIERKGRSENQLKILEKINQMFPKKGRLLDVGCATGAFIELALKDGWDVIGIEPSKWASKIAKEQYGLPVQQGTINSLKIKNQNFDVVVCLDVIEHVNSPRNLLAEINKVLKPNGLLCIVTPDKASKIASLLGEKWWHVRSDHIFYFTEKTINLLLASENFKILTKSRYGWTFSFDYWLSRFKNNIPLLYEIGIFMKKLPFLNYFTKRTYNINFHDSLEFYYVKKSRES